MLQMPLVRRWLKVNFSAAASTTCLFTVITVAGEIDTIEILQGRSIDDVIEAIKAQAVQKAIQSGANPGMSFHIFRPLPRTLPNAIPIVETTKIVEVSNLPVQVSTPCAALIAIL
jgi:hypothetical protein